MTEATAFLPATRLLELYRAKTLSPVEVMTETLRRLETYEAAVNAFVLYDPESALAEARASAARWQRGAPKGLLDGLPVALKDTLLTRGWPRLVGSKAIDPNQAWDEDSPVADAALMLDAMKGPDSRDWYSLPDDGIAYRERLRGGSLKGKRVALSPSLGYAEPAPAVREAVERAGRLFAELGAVVEPADPFGQSPQPIFEALALGCFWALLPAMEPGAGGLMGSGLGARCPR